ncbi:MAG: hypothetical protein CFE45_11230 [Burkholderiales bacterium PBB5]|nr:MAG: hypothetical protein CFE45_11230 [Burkholderiales bacterium PBB5]
MPAMLVLVAPLMAAPMHYRHNAPESPLDRRYVYHWKVLETALEKTRATHGDYVLEPGEVMTEARQLFELERATGSLTVVYQGTTPVIERTLWPVRIPVDRDLVGYRVLLVRRERLDQFASVRSVADLKTVTFGFGLGWLDGDVVRANGLRVVTGSSYEGLFDMLNNGRFEAFPRGAVEILDEWQARRERYPELAIEPSLLVYYPMPMYFWFARDDVGRSLAERAEAGMRLMIADGSYDRLFAEYQDQTIVALGLKHRRILRLSNPLLGPETPLQDRRLWFDPTTYQPGGRR